MKMNVVKIDQDKCKRGSVLTKSSKILLTFVVLCRVQTGFVLMTTDFDT